MNMELINYPYEVDTDNYVDEFGEIDWYAVADEEYVANEHLKNYLSEKLTEFFAQFKGKNVRITGKNMGWLNLSGEKVMEVEEFVRNPIRAIAPNTDEFSQEWEFDGKKLTVRQAHHDAQGDVYTFRTGNFKVN